jgi:hypothetical protein
MTAVETPRWELRRLASRLDYSSLQYLAEHDRCPAMHRAECRREMRRRDRAMAQWFADFLLRMMRNV